MKVDVNILNNNVIPKLTQSKSSLKEADSIISSILIPDDFPDAGRVRAARGKIGSIISMIASAQSSVAKSINSFNRTTAQNNQIIKNMLRKLKWYRKLYGCK